MKPPSLHSWPSCRSSYRRQPARPLPNPRGHRADTVDLDAIQRIKDEGLERSQVMDTVWNLTDVHGPRLTNSPAVRAAADWAGKRLTGWGVSNVRQETWGPFGRGWANEKFTANVVAPQPFPLIAFPRAWTPGTNGPVTAEVVAPSIRNDQDMAAWSGKLNGQDRDARQQPPKCARSSRRSAAGSPIRSWSTSQSQPVNAGRGRGGRARRPAGRSQLQPALHAVPGQGRRRWPPSSRPRAAATTARSWCRTRRPRIATPSRRSSRRRSWSPRSTTTASRACSTQKVPVQLELNVQNRFFDEHARRVQPDRRDPRHRPRRRGGDARRALRLVARGHRRHRQRRRVRR